MFPFCKPEKAPYNASENSDGVYKTTIFINSQTFFTARVLQAQKSVFWFSNAHMHKPLLCEKGYLLKEAESLEVSCKTSASELKSYNGTLNPCWAV